MAGCAANLTDEMIAWFSGRSVDETKGRVSEGRIPLPRFELCSRCKERDLACPSVMMPGYTVEVEICKALMI